MAGDRERSAQDFQDVNMAEGQPKQLVADVSRDIIEQIAPDELVLFRATSEAYFKDPAKALKQQGGKDEMLGFGFEEAIPLLTPVVLAVTEQVVRYLAAAFAKAATDKSADMAAAGVRSLSMKLHPTPGGASAGPPPLTTSQLSEVRQVAMEKAQQLNLSEAQARLLADSMVGRLAVATGS